MKIVLILPAARHLRVTQENQNVPRRKMLRFSVLSLKTLAAYLNFRLGEEEGLWQWTIRALAEMKSAAM